MEKRILCVTVFIALLVLAGPSVIVAQQTQEEETTTPLYGKEGVNPRAVKQGTLGSCYFHSVVAALAASNPDGVSKMIHAQTDGTYTVQFADGKKEIAYPEDIQYSRQSGYELSEGLWVAVLFRAYAQRVLREALVQAVDKSEMLSLVKTYAEDFINTNDAVVLGYDRAIRAAVDQQGNIDKVKLRAALKAELQPIAVPDDMKDSFVKLIESGGFFDSIETMIRDNGEIFGAYRAVGHGGVAGRAMQALAGSAIEVLNDSADQASGALAGSIGARRPAVACTAGSRFYQQLAENQPLPAEAQPWYVNAHCFTVLGYDADTRTVTLRNPWGQKPAPDGVFRIPLASFLPAFRGIVTTEK